MVSWAYIYLAEDAAPGGERFVRDGTGERTTLAAVPDEESAARLAAGLADEGVGLIELCGGFGPEGAARVIAAVGGRVPVGTVGFGIESLQGAAAYQRAAGEAAAGAG